MMESEDEDDDDDEPVIEKILDMKKDPATRASLALVKWRHWPERSGDLGTHGKNTTKRSTRIDERISQLCGCARRRIR
jgi:hypothetical protein